MNWQFDKKALRAALHHLAGLTDRNYPLVDAVFNGSDLALMFDNTNTQFAVRVQAKSAGEPFACGLPGELFYRIVKAMQNDTVDISKQDQMVTMSDGGSEATLWIAKRPEIRVEDYVSPRGNTKRARFASALEAVSCAVHPDRSSHLSGIHVEQKYGDNWLVATDGYRIHAVLLTGNLGLDEPATVPVEALELAVEAVPDHMLRIGTRNGILRAQGSGVSIVARSFAQPYKDWHSLVSPHAAANVETAVVFDGDELATAVKTINDAMKPKAIGMHLVPDTNTITLSGSSEYGTMVRTVRAEVSNGESQMRFAARYLMDALDNCGPGATLTVPTSGAVHFRSANPWFRAAVAYAI